ncbi:Pentatricopeptide repeat-containing protein, mitochondrial [Vitis vinifera]|uniref:Pentatricopeptide repeat-containing protein, mitochondrial n=1 Tax=Vitis vinifera TaxID=29760 RepID=A0A438KBM7_VITVI|nr:Pentatricopeptide repeat-containing protein, mitochondrial [Vitis vinifera]
MLILAKRLSSLRPTEPLLKPISYNYNLTTTTSPPSPPQDATIVNLVLKTDSQTLTRTLEKYPVEWTPNLVDRVLKLLWNHGPKALQFFKSLDYHPTYAHVSSSFDHAIDIAGRLRDYKTLWTLVDRMRTRRLGPNPKTFAIITERYVSAGKPDRAIKIFFSMHEHGCVQDLNSFNTILDVLCKSKRVEMADNKLFKVFRGRFRADTVSYNIMANGWCLIKRTPKALEVLKEMVKRGLNPTMTTYNILLKGFFRAGQLKEAWEFFLQMKKRKCEIDVVTYTTVVHGFGVAGEVRKAQRVFNEMIGRGQSRFCKRNSEIAEQMWPSSSSAQAVKLSSIQIGVSTLIEAAMFYPVSKIFMSDGCDHILNSMKLSDGYSIASASQNRTFLMQAVDKKGYEWDGSIFRILRPWDGSIHLC